MGETQVTAPQHQDLEQSTALFTSEPGEAPEATMPVAAPEAPTPEAHVDGMAVTARVSESVHTSVLDRLRGTRAGNFLARTAVVLAGFGGASAVAGAAAAEAAGSHHQRGHHERNIMSGEEAYNDTTGIFTEEYPAGPLPAHMNTTGSVIKEHHYAIKGTCKKFGLLEKQSGGDYALQLSDLPQVQVQTYCGTNGGKHIVRKIKRKQWPLTSEETPPNWLSLFTPYAEEAATRDGVSGKHHGSVEKVVTHNKIGIKDFNPVPIDEEVIITYAKNPAGSGRQLKKLIATGTKQHPHNHKIWYPQHPRHGHK